MVHSIIQRFIKGKALRQYLYKLGPLLVKRYGFSKYYTVDQVRVTIDETEMNKYWAGYAYATYLRSVDFDICKKKMGFEQEYLPCRSEIKNKYFPGLLTDFEIEHVLKLSTEDIPIPPVDDRYTTNF